MAVIPYTYLDVQTLQGQETKHYHGQSYILDLFGIWIYYLQGQKTGNTLELGSSMARRLAIILLT